MTEEDLREKVRHRIRQEFKTHGQAAWKMGINDSRLSEYLAGKTIASRKIREFMGVQRVVTVAYEACAVPVQIQAKDGSDGAVGKA